MAIEMVIMMTMTLVMIELTMMMGMMMVMMAAIMVMMANRANAYPITRKIVNPQLLMNG